MAAPKILMLVTSHDKMGELDRPTGFWLEEFTTPYYVFVDGGAEVTIATPKGGPAPVDPKSAEADWATDSTRRHDSDENLQQQLANTVKLADLDASDFDAVFVPGGHGPMWDYPGNSTVKAVLEAFAAAEKPLASVCHGPASLVDLETSDGEPLVKGRRVTAFSNTEEVGVDLHEVVPFMLETRLRELGAQYEKAGDWVELVIQDGFLITGQNPASSAGAAQAVLDSLED